MSAKNLFNEEIDLIILAYTFLCQQARKTHKQYTVGDLFWTMEILLRKIELSRRGK